MKSPGSILFERFMQPKGLTQNGLARSLGVPAQRINEIINDKRSITTDTALRLARYFGTSAFYWMDLQARYDLERAEEGGLVDQIHRQVQVPVATLSQRTRSGHGRIEEQSLLVHRAIAKKLEENPEKVLETARQNVRRWGWDKEENPAPYMKAWMNLLEGPLPRLVQVLTGEGERSVLLRSSSPFKGVLAQAEQDCAIHGEGADNDAMGA